MTSSPRSDASLRPVRQVLVVGGGTAGWLTAAFLARQLGTAAGGVAVSLVESPEIGIIGVGEGSFPSIKGTLATLGIDEARFVRATQATFKQGIRFSHWVRPPGRGGADHYFHPFNAPSQRAGGPELLPYWLLGAAAPGTAYADAATLQKAVVDAARAPRRVTDADYAGPMNYAYHFDAARLAALLAEQGRALGVTGLQGTVERVELREDGAIAAVHTAEGARLAADLFVDCTGFRALLLGQALGVPYRRRDDVLLVDRALALQVPYAQADAPLPSCTLSTAHEAGWTWDIGLQARRGVGYVYSSRHTTDARALEVLRAHVGPAADTLEPRALRLDVGYRETQWVKNCVAVGLSSGFIEPLEASGIGLVETAAYLLAFGFPFDGAFEPAARRFNALMAARYERIVDFVKMHYALTRRTDHAFWIDNADPRTWTDSLRELLAQWRTRPPHRLDFITDLEMYPPSSWQYVLYGMEFETDLGAASAGLARRDEAAQEFRMIRRLGAHAQADLPPHRALVSWLCAHAAGAA